MKVLYIMLLLAFPFIISCKSDNKKENAESVQTFEMKAPIFALQDINGDTLRLSDFKGKIVILDFWGGWCPWCIKGFPALKAAYKKYAGHIEIIGIDCNESEADWKKAVAQNSLPWKQVINGSGDHDILSLYGVNAFPTKFIINEKGNIVKMSVGEDPDFFISLEQLLSKE